MKVLHLSSEKTWRGGEQQVAYLIAELNRLGIENVVAAKKDSDFAVYCAKHGVAFTEIPFNNSVDLGSSLLLKKICRMHLPDIIHLHSSKSHSIYAWSTALGLQTPAILSRRVDFAINNTLINQWKYNISSIEKIICVSKEIQKVIKPVIRDKQKVHVVYSGIDLRKFEKAEAEDLHLKFDIPKGRKIIGNTSALAAHKDYYTFINTARNLLENHDDLHFLILGEGRLRPQLQHYIQKLNLQDRILMPGHISPIESFLKSFDVFLMTSSTEGLGTSVLDAFAAGVPVVSTAGGGLKEIVIHQETGLVSEVGDSASLARDVSFLLNHPDERNKLIRQARDWVQKFDKEITAKKTLDQYRAIVGNNEDIIRR